MQKITVTDTSCLILLYNINELELLRKVYSEIRITKTIFEEFNKPIPEWIIIQEPKTDLHVDLIGYLDPGESTAISLAYENEDNLLIIDESRGREVAKDLGIKITGTLGVLIAAKKRGIIDYVNPLLEKIKQTDFRMTDQLVLKVLRSCNEI